MKVLSATERRKRKRNDKRSRKIVLLCGRGGMIREAGRSHDIMFLVGRGRGIIRQSQEE